MTLIADTHIHLYPCYNTAAALNALSANLGRLATGGGARGAFLAERADCRAFAALAAGESAGEPTGLRVERGDEACALTVTREGGEAVHLFAGRQIACAERIEVLALMLEEAPPDGTPAEAAVDGVLEHGGIPVLAWAPGKWSLRGRADVVRGLLERHSGGALLVGDSTLRPAGWPEPALMQRARRSGLRVLAGSDPLPFPGEERCLGQYASVLDGAFDATRPAASARAMLTGRGGDVPMVGQRCEAIDVAVRLWRNHRASKASRATVPVAEYP